MCNAEAFYLRLCPSQLAVINHPSFTSLLTCASPTKISPFRSDIANEMPSPKITSFSDFIKKHKSQKSDNASVYTAQSSIYPHSTMSDKPVKQIVDTEKEYTKALTSTLCSTQL